MTALGCVDHPNVVKAFDAGEEDGRSYLVMERIDGLNVSDLRRRSESVPIKDACEIIRQAATGLDHAHSQGLVHRDVKPSNLMVHADGTVKVLDLGLAMFSDLHCVPEKDISARLLMGTVEYMAPEQMSGRHAVDERADIYSLGVTFYELLTGRTPWSTADSGTLLQQLGSMALQDAPAVRSVRPEVPHDIAAVVDRMLIRSCQDRNVTASEVAAILGAHSSGADLVSLLDRWRRPEDRGETIAEYSEVASAGRRKLLRRMKSRATLVSLAVVALLGLATAARLKALQGPKDHQEHTERNVTESGVESVVELTAPATILTGLESNVMDLQIFSHDQKCATVTWDGDLNIWDLATGERTEIPGRTLKRLRCQSSLNPS